MYFINMSKKEIDKKSKLIKGQVSEEVVKFTDNKSEQLKEKVEPIEKNIQEEIEHVRNTSEKELERKGKIIKG